MRHLVLIALCACGDPLVGSSFSGTPELSLGGVVVQSNTRIPSSHGPLGIGVFWISAADARVEQRARLDSGLAEFSLTLFDPPPQEAAAFSDLLPGGTLAMGVIVLYADADESGDLDLSQDLLLGASAQHVLVHAWSAVEPDTPAAALLGTIGTGYHVYQHDRPSACRFVDAEGCAGEGGLLSFEETGNIPLNLWAEPDQVIVPAPALRSGSIWTPAE